MVTITIGNDRFRARFQDELAPRTCARVRQLLPWSAKLIHVRWSGEACWIPLGDLDLGLTPEAATDRPAPGQLLLYPGGISETEVLLAYGEVAFASRFGRLAGNPFMLVLEKQDRLAAVGREILWEGARSIRISA